MKSAIAIITYRRVHALAAMLQGIAQHCPHYTTAVFEDCGQRDQTSDFLQSGRRPIARPEILSTEYVPDETKLDKVLMPTTMQVFMGTRNVGVASVSNKAIKWFMDGDWDHLLLCNDDLFVKGDFAKVYAQAHKDLEVGMFCFCDFTEASPAISGTPDTYKWQTAPWRGYKIKLLPRFTGIMISLTRSLLEKVGYFDAAFGKFGEEHCDFTVRCRLAGGIKVNGRDMNCLDIEHDCLAHQDVETSMAGPSRQVADQEAHLLMSEASKSYKYRHYYRPFGMCTPHIAGGYRGGGIPVRRLQELGYELVQDFV